MTKFDTEQMGNPDDIMEKLSGNKFFTKIDLCEGYWQIQMGEDSKEQPLECPTHVTNSRGWASDCSTQ